MARTPTIENIGKMREITRDSANRYAKELFNYEVIGEKIAVAASKGESSIRIKHDRYIDLENTTYAQGLFKSYQLGLSGRIFTRHSQSIGSSF